jgi:soluble lytic murein transglycosylase-like protein
MKIIHYWLKAMALLLTLVASPVHATQYQTELSASKWIQEHTRGKVHASTAKNIVSQVFQEARKRDIDPFLLLSLIKAESTFNPKASNSHGAKGLTQVVPRWHRDKIKGRNIYDIKTNIEVGAAVLDDCLVKHKNVISKALKCYSGGASPKYAKTIKSTHAAFKKAQLLHFFQAGLPLNQTAYFSKPREFFTEPAQPLQLLASM